MDEQRSIGNQRSLGYPFAGIPSFLRAPIQADLARLDADIAVLGVPSDDGSPYLPGSRFGPRRIREHSLRFGVDGYYDGRLDRTFLEHELTQGLVADTGDVDVLPTNPEGTWANITAAMRQILVTGALPVVIGGDHSVSAPVVRAWDRPIHVVHFDAHIDYTPFRHGFEFTNIQPMRHIRAMPHVKSLTQVGIRSLRNRRSDVHDSIGDGNRVIAMDEFRDLGPRSIAATLPAEAAVYISIDIDVLDQALVPGCVSGEPDGFAYNELRESLIALCEHTDVVGFDLVEVNPLLDVGTGATSYLAAHTIVELLGHICDQQRWVSRRAERAELRGRSAL
ncbi:MAG: arginase family protein [Chloroflexota bacterium]|nr:arginase family protein [Chloroflexota bacterium]